MSKQKIHLDDLEEEDQSQQPQKFGLPSFLVILILMGIFFVSPIPNMLASLIPHSIVKSVISPVFQNITLDEAPLPLTTPKKYQNTEELTVLGRDSGVCFTFNTMDKEQKNRITRGKLIAEIIAVTPDKTEYMLDKITLDEVSEYSKSKKQNITTYVVCQKFSTSSIILPDTITTIYTRPIKPFTPLKIMWATKADIK